MIVKTSRIIIAGLICVCILNWACGSKPKEIEPANLPPVKPDVDQIQTSTQNENPTSLFPIKKDGKWGYIGYIDNALKMVIIPQFDFAEEFSEGLARVSISGKYGFIDETGKIVIDPQFDSASGFDRWGKAQVWIGHGKTGKWACIDKQGCKEGWIDEQGRFHTHVEFSEEWANLRIGDYKSGLWALIDKTGEVVINHPVSKRKEVWFRGEPTEPGPLQMNDKWCYVYWTGKHATEAQFDYASHFYDGLGVVKIGGKWGYVNSTGKYAINPQFGDAYPFCEGLATVKIGGKWGLIDKTGEIVGSPQFDAICDFCEGLALVKMGGKWGYIDKTVNIVINPQFDEAWDFSDGLARVRIGDEKTGKYGYIDKTGEYVWEPTN